MKGKLVSIICMALVFSSLFSLPTMAAAMEFEEYSIETVYNEEGGHYTITIQTFSTRATRAGSKTTTYTNDAGVVCWTYTLNGTFYYDGSTASCLQTSSSYAIYVNGWTCTKDSPYVSGASAKADATFTFLSLTKNLSTTLTCDKDGGLS